MKYSRITTLVASLAILAGISSSCSSTDVVDELMSAQEKGKEITLNISTPPELRTKASSDHVLRYTAKLFKDRYDNPINGYQFLERKQAIASTGECTIVFSVPEGDYSVLIFADYVPLPASADSNGFYDDIYYDTTSPDESITMLAFTNDAGSLLHHHCINNENYDCFSGYTGVINKGPEKEERDIVLKRAAAKIRFVSSTPPPSTVQEISFSKFAYYDIYQQFAGSAFSDKTYADMGLENYVVKMSDSSENELFYFYTLAGKSSYKLNDIAFNVKFQNGQNYQVSIPAGTIRFTQNYVTTVKGAFLSDRQTETGDIILNLSKSDEWSGSEEQMPF